MDRSGSTCTRMLPRTPDSAPHKPFKPSCCSRFLASNIVTMASTARTLVPLRRRSATAAAHVLTSKPFTSAADSAASSDSDPTLSSSSESKGMYVFVLLLWILHLGRSCFLQCSICVHKNAIFFKIIVFLIFIYLFLVWGVLKEKGLDGCCFYLGQSRLALGLGKFSGDKIRCVFFSGIKFMVISKMLGCVWF